MTTVNLGKQQWVATVNCKLHLEWLHWQKFLWNNSWLKSWKTSKYAEIIQVLFQNSLSKAYKIKSKWNKNMNLNFGFSRVWLKAVQFVYYLNETAPNYFRGLPAGLLFFFFFQLGVVFFFFFLSNFSVFGVESCFAWVLTVGSLLFSLYFAIVVNY